MESPRHARARCRPGALVVGAIALLVAAPSAALQIQVDWSSTNGTGTVSGSFGVFDVTAAGQEFSLPTDGSLTATTSGFTNTGFANTTYALDMAGGDLRFRFDSLAPVQGQLVDLSSDRLWGDVTCDPFGGTCIVQIDGVDRAQVGFDTGPFYAEPLAYTYTVVPEPAALGMLGAGLLGAVFRRARARAAV